MTWVAVMVSRVAPGVAGALVSVSWTVQSWTWIFTTSPAGMGRVVDGVLRAEMILALPLMNSILFFFIRNSTPLLSLAATSRERLMVLDQSCPMVPSILRPQASFSWSFSMSSALERRALVGMQPQLRQTPPSLSRSMMATL